MRPRYRVFRSNSWFTFRSESLPFCLVQKFTVLLIARKKIGKEGTVMVWQVGDKTARGEDFQDTRRRLSSRRSRRNRSVDLSQARCPCCGWPLVARQAAQGPRFACGCRRSPNELK